MHTIRHRTDGRHVGHVCGLATCNTGNGDEHDHSYGKRCSLEVDLESSGGTPRFVYALVIGAERAKEVLNRLPQHLRSEAFKDIDFERQAAIVAYLGEAPRGGYAVDIHSVQISDHQVWVNISRRAQDPMRSLPWPSPIPLPSKSLPLADLPKDGYEVRLSIKTVFCFPEQTKSKYLRTHRTGTG